MVARTLIAASLASLVVVVVAAGCGAGRPAGSASAQARHVPPFRSVELAGSNDVTIGVGRRQSVVVYGDAGVLRRVTTNVEAGNLVIGNTRGRLTSRSPMRVEITMPLLTALRLSGTGVVSAGGITGVPLQVTLSGSGVIRAAGNATDLAVTLDGSGDAQLGGLVARNVVAVLSGSGRILVSAMNRLDASVPGSGLIIYVGHPAHVTASVTGSGAVVPIGDEFDVS
jgi:hypothetical protein